MCSFLLRTCGDAFVYSGDDTAASVNDIRQHAGLPERFAAPGTAGRALVAIGDQKMLVPKKALTMPKPVWHPPWKLFRVRFWKMFFLVCICCTKFLHFVSRFFLMPLPT